MNASKLKPCPFCGCRCVASRGFEGWVVLADEFKDDDNTHEVWCPLAFTITQNYQSTKRAAIVFWNRRAK